MQHCDFGGWRVAKLGRPGLPDSERRRVWELWKGGQGFSAISREVGVPPGSVFSILKPRGGIYFPCPRPRKSALTLAEREEISRGLAAGMSLRKIAERLGRAPFTVSRESGPQWWFEVLSGGGFS